MIIVKIGNCGDERDPDTAPAVGRLTPYFTWENNPERSVNNQSFGSAIYGTTCLFLEIP